MPQCPASGYSPRRPWWLAEFINALTGDDDEEEGDFRLQDDKDDD